MPSANDDPESLTKEDCVSLEEIFYQHSLKTSKAPTRSHSKLEILQVLLSIPLGQRWRLLYVHSKKLITSRLGQFFARRKVRRAHLKIGYLFVDEQFEFTSNLDFSSLFGFVIDIARRIERISSKNNSVLIVRRKTGWTNFNLLRKQLQGLPQDSRPRNLIFGTDGTTLKQFGSDCNVVLYLQGSSAVPELMSLGTPVLRLVDSHATVMLGEPYIVPPDHVVPGITIEELLSRVAHDHLWLSGLSKLQKNWVTTQMYPN